MTLLALAVLIIVAGLLLWAATTYIPMDPKIKNILVIVVVAVVALVALSAFGVFDAIRGVQVPRIG
jgi:4-amino-4-deoxy-L-arabinose transferase-like glycosyltransferase